MKTYTKKEYKQFYGVEGVLFASMPYPYFSWHGKANYCFCTRKFKNNVFYHAYENCKNCHGYGVPPIPWSELE